MPAYPEPEVRPALATDAERVAAIFAHYVTTSVATFEEVAPAAADWQRRAGYLTALGLPFLVAESDGEVCGFAYASPWLSAVGRKHGRWIDTVLMQKDLGVIR